MIVPRATLPAAAVSARRGRRHRQLARRRRRRGRGDGDDGDGDGAGDGDAGEDGGRDGADFETAACAETAPGLNVDPSPGAGDAVVPAFVPGWGLAMTGCPPDPRRRRGPGTPPPRATGEVGARCEPPSISRATTPPSTIAPATAATAAARGRRRTSCHHRGPDETAGLGNPVRLNEPARCVTLARYARPVGVLSAQAARTLSLSSSGRVTSGIASSGARYPAGRDPAGRDPAAGEAGTPASGPSRRRHSFRTTACSQDLSRSGSVELRQLRGGDDEGVLHGLGGAAHRIRVGQHEPAVGVQWRRVAVVRLGEPVRLTCGDGGDQLAVLHAPTVVGGRIAGSRNR